MSEMSNSERADMIFRSLCNVLNNNNIKYKTEEDKKTVSFILQGKDLPIEFYIVVDEGRQIIRLYSQLPFVMPEDKRIEGAIAACIYSFSLVDGNFDCDIGNGIIQYRLSQSFLNRSIGDDLFMYMLSLTNSVVEAYNDKFFTLSKGMLSIDEIINQQN